MQSKRMRPSVIVTANRSKRMFPLALAAPIAITAPCSIGKALTTGGADIYTVPVGFSATIRSIFICNVAGAVKTVTMDWYDGATSFNILSTKTVSANSYLNLTDIDLSLAKDNKITGLAEANSSIEVIISVNEYFTPHDA